ncbi:hypothetical protein AMAG_03933 [Allomyces macrogynus ATCC 38327]|uniref:Uncharacterized protein n=1 Tax=Allomyces macrogynus (strain ATCC 38327) TaxID=578462 RepID=A0A0L0S7L7_ALLM3|nr:hypothetical protein AMAG_03933 [Allomyces macrogynus ATCC 38327]|eukprot:KNE58349.1 hypothetical protein AMAG_03933 [Allomyces macrogynus ATCC 38327]
MGPSANDKQPRDDARGLLVGAAAVEDEHEVELEQLDNASPGIAATEQDMNNAEMGPQISDPASEHVVCPMDQANWFSKLYYTWSTPIMKRGYDHPLQEPDLFPLGREFMSREILDAFQSHFDDDVAAYRLRVPSGSPDDKVPSRILLRALWKSFGRSWAIAGLAKLIGDGTSLAIPVFVAQIISFLSACQAAPDAPCSIGEGFAWVAAMFVCQVISSAATNFFWHRSMLTGLQARTALITAAFSKSMRLSNHARVHEWNTGKVVNVVTTDTNRIDVVMPWVHTMWTSTLQIIIAMVLMVNYIGWAALAGIGLLVLFVPMQSRAMRAISAFRRKSQRITDRRVKLVNELLQGMKVVKLLAWERPFLAKIEEERHHELALVTRVLVLKSVLIGVAIAVPSLSAVLLFSIYAINHPLVPSIVFGTLSFLNLIRMPLWQVPQSYGFIMDATVSVRRITDLLTAPEVDSLPLIHDGSGGAEVPAIEVKGASFRWESHSHGPANAGAGESEPVLQDGGDKLAGIPADLSETSSDEADDDSYLRDINLAIPKGQLVAIIGKVGSGKSSLLSAIVGEMKRTSGSVVLDGKLAYCPQVPWIQNASLKENVLFGADYDDEAYRRAIYLSALQKDLERLPAGDATEIGEKGINLSGGQKARANLARALYSDANIMLMDDILAAVDAHVAAFLFHACIKSSLHGKTRVLVTHSLSYAVQCDYIVLMEKGRIAEHGTTSECMARGGAVADMLSEYLGNEKYSRQGPSSSSASENDVEIAGAPPGQAVETAPAAPLTQSTALMLQEERETGAVKGNYYGWYLQYCGGYLYTTFVVFLLALGQALRVVVDLWLVWWTNDKFSWPLPTYIGTYTAWGLGQGVVAILSNVVFVHAGVRASWMMHNAALTRVAFAPLGFFDQTPLGRILARFSKDVDQTDNTLIDAFRMFLRSVAMLLSVMALLVAATPFLAIPLVILLGIYLVIQRFYRATTRELKRLDSLTRSPLYAHIGESLNGLATIRAYAEQPRFLRRNAQLMDRNNRPYFHTITAARWLGVRLELIGACITTLCAVLGILARNTIGPALLGLSLSYGLQITMLLNNCVFQGADAESQMNSVERLDYYADHLPQERGVERPEPRRDGQLVAPPETPAEWPSRGEIVICDLELKYGNDVAVLRGVNAYVPPGTRVGVLGRTGAGKTSLVSALLRLVEPSAGSIAIDGLDTRDVSLHDLRSRVAIIPQDPVLFEGTVRSNLDRFSQFDDQHLWDCLTRAGLANRIASLDGKIDAHVVENGENFSLGERCCMCLARAMVGTKQIVVMDEVTASIDLDTETTIQASIRRDFGGVTILTIAHRLHTVIDYDLLLVMDHGQVVESGAPLELLNQTGSIFASMVEETGAANAAVLRRLAEEAEAAKRSRSQSSL